MSKERERIINKQKYKRSEQVRSMLDNKKMSSLTKERRDTDHSSRAQPMHHNEHAYQPPPFKDINLASIINSTTGKDYEATL